MLIFMQNSPMKDENDAIGPNCNFTKVSGIHTLTIVAIHAYLDEAGIHTTNKHKQQSLRLRGSGDDPNFDKQWNKSPALDAKGFKYNGMPQVDFTEKTLAVLKNGLGAIADREASLLDNVLRNDPGGTGPLANPAFGAAPADVRERQRLRSKRSFAVIMNYIEPKSWLFKYAMRVMNNDGPDLFEYLIVHGTISTPRRVKKSRDEYWQSLTFDNEKLTRHPESLFKWVYIVMEIGRKCSPSKSPVQIRDKFLDGMPAFFESTTQVYKNEPNKYQVPANYPPHAPSALRGTPHPDAGEPDVERQARAMYEEWVSKLSGDISSRGNMNQTRAFAFAATIPDHRDEPDQAFILTTDINSEMRCFICGGYGHLATQTTPDGQVIECPTKAMMTQPPVGSKGDKEIKAMRDQVKDLKKKNKGLEKVVKSFSGIFRKGNKKQAFVTTEEESDDKDEELDMGMNSSVYEETDDDDDDAQSAQSDKSEAFEASINDFARSPKALAGTSASHARKPFKPSKRSSK